MVVMQTMTGELRRRTAGEREAYDEGLAEGKRKAASDIDRVRDNLGRAIRRQTVEIVRLKAVLEKIADSDYSEADESLTSSEPIMIWQAVARKALENDIEG